MTNSGAVLGLFGGGRFGQAHGVHRVPEGEGTALRGDGDSLHGRVQLYQWERRRWLMGRFDRFAAEGHQSGVQYDCRQHLF